MLMTRLGLIASGLCKINRSTSLLFQRNIKTKLVKADENDDLDDKPIIFSKSKASEWKAAYRRMVPNERVWFTSHVVTLSTAIFLLYFCVLREENDIDERIYQPLPETIIGIDKAFPEIDFYRKPDYVLFHEERKTQKEQVKQEAR